MPATHGRFLRVLTKTFYNVIRSLKASAKRGINIIGLGCKIKLGNKIDRRQNT